MISNVELWENLLSWLATFDGGIGAAANVKLVETECKSWSPIYLIALSNLTNLAIDGRGLVARFDIAVSRLHGTPPIIFSFQLKASTAPSPTHL